ncbi:MAG TPA: class I SAM-dependent methyltransferase [Candidatus Paceibacterota bacterium]
MAFSKPQEVVAQFHLQSGLTVADFGTGSGAYALALARAVGAAGRVYAVDIQKEVLARLAREAKASDLEAKLPRGSLASRIEVIRGDLEQTQGSTLADQSVDFVVIANLLFQVSAKYNLVREAKRILKSNGQVAFIDWSGSFGGLGPKPEQVLLPAEAKKIFAEAGFVFLHEFPAGDQHYGLLFESDSQKPKS